MIAGDWKIMRGAVLAKTGQRADAPRAPRVLRPRPAGQIGPKIRERNCSVARTLSVLSDAWTFLVICEAFFGARRFESFRAALGLPRATLTVRLKRLAEQ